MPPLFCLKLEYLSVCFTVDFHDSSTHPHHLTIWVLFSCGRFTTGSQLLPQEGLKSLDGFFALFSSFPIRSILHGRVSVTACSPNQKSLNAFPWAQNTGLKQDCPTIDNLSGLETLMWNSSILLNPTGHTHNSWRSDASFGSPFSVPHLHRIMLWTNRYSLLPDPGPSNLTPQNYQTTVL